MMVPTAASWRAVRARDGGCRRVRPQCDAHAKIARALRDELRQHAVESHRGEQERQDRESTQQAARKPPLPHAVDDALLEGEHIEEALIRIDRANDGGGRLRQRCRVARRPDDVPRPGGGYLRIRR
jgi:hypothetical protein